jgi:hypothetical protein
VEFKIMTEVEWVELVANTIRPAVCQYDASLEIRTGLKIAYGNEILAYEGTVPHSVSWFETDLAVIENLETGGWKPRMIIEAKYRSITTHDAITYSQKASAHKAVHPFLRYGIMLGEREHHPLPGRLFRHGAEFDFMISFPRNTLSEDERVSLEELIKLEVEASRTLERMLYESRSSKRERFTFLHKRLTLS